jgi:hypothetical protein
MTKFKEGSAELEMLNDMVTRDFSDLYDKLHPRALGEAAKMATSYPRTIVIMQHVGRYELYEELGANVEQYRKLIEKEMEEAAKLAF